MKNQISFPLLVLLLLLAGCQTKEELDRRKSAFGELVGKARAAEAKQLTDSAFYYLQQAAVDFPDLPDGRVYALLEQARLYQKVCDFQESEQVLTEALSLDINQKYHYYLHNLLGNTFQEQYLYDEAQQHFDEALAATSDSLLQAITRNNKAVVYLEQQRYGEAVAELKPLLELPWLTTQPVYAAKFRDNLGFAYWHQGDSLRAMPLLLEAERERNELGDDYERIASLMHLARVYLPAQPELGLEKAREAYEAATRVASADDRLEALDLLIRHADTESAKGYYEIYSRIEDSLERSRLTAKNQFAKIKYDATVHQLKAQRERQLRLITLLVLGLFMGGALWIYRTIQRKNRLKLMVQQQQVSYETETRIAKKLHDELANEVFQTLSFVQTQPLEPHREDLLNALDRLYDKTRNISKEHETIQTGKHFSEDMKSMMSVFQTPGVNVLVKDTGMDWAGMPADMQILWYRVVQELLVNMKKHSRASLVVLQFEEEKTQWKLRYSDNGIGFNTKKSSGGLQNVENRIFTVHGSISFDSEPDKGLKINLAIPKR
jgi:signal transduction histidine kinase